MLTLRINPRPSHRGKVIASYTATGSDALSLFGHFIRKAAEDAWVRTHVHHLYNGAFTLTEG